MSQRSHLTESEAWRVVGRLEGGQTKAEVAEAIGVSQSVISRIWNRFMETGNAGRRSGQGRRHATTPNEDHNLTLTVRRHRNMNVTLLQTAPSLGYWHHSFDTNYLKPPSCCRSVCSPTNGVGHVNSKAPSRLQGGGQQSM
ncbi:hypothetical protein HNY73_012052 [Argiope bruennichi]|uniref:Paired domain-containing protein n=1 Tax=Argiope bruennichi TaxID=94029 RepID=A0A8T0EYG4_ARGBR|nr:hypothetical protein HNY73_012052 [Argiope bruennichi]